MNILPNVTSNDFLAERIAWRARLDAERLEALEDFFHDEPPRVVRERYDELQPIWRD